MKTFVLVGMTPNSDYGAPDPIGVINADSKEGALSWLGAVKSQHSPGFEISFETVERLALPIESSWEDREGNHYVVDLEAVPVLL